MRPEARQHLLDLLRAAEEAIEVSRPGPIAWNQDRVRSLAIERLLLNIGEACRRLYEDEIAVFDLLPDGREYIGLRNVLAHAYDRVDERRLHAVIEDDLPRLLEAVRVILS